MQKSLRTSRVLTEFQNLPNLDEADMFRGRSYRSRVSCPNTFKKVNRFDKTLPIINKQCPCRHL